MTTRSILLGACKLVMFEKDPCYASPVRLGGLITLADLDSFCINQFFFSAKFAPSIGGIDVHFTPFIALLRLSLAPSQVSTTSTIFLALFFSPSSLLSLSRSVILPPVPVRSACFEFLSSDSSLTDLIS